MAINVSQAFKRTSANPIDETFALTKAQMKTVNDNLMPAYYFTICQEDGKIYLYDKSATASATTGKFTEFSGGGGGGSSDVKFFTTTDTLSKDINGTKVVAAADLPGVTWSDLVVGSSVIKDAKGTMGLVTTITGTTSVTVTTATTSTPTVELTQAQYDALATKDPDTIYFITDNYVGSTYVGAYDTIYSTTERVIGSYMGKPLYQRTWKSSTVQVISNAGWGQQFSIPKAGMEQIVKCIGNGNSLYGGQAWQFMANLDSSETYVSFLAARDGNPAGATEVTLQYTKTADTTSPVEYASPNDYSTSEKIVGTWTDGKPIYQKTVYRTFDLPATTWTALEPLATSNIDLIIHCVMRRSTKGVYYPLCQNVGTNVSIYYPISMADTTGYTIQYTKAS